MGAGVLHEGRGDSPYLLSVAVPPDGTGSVAYNQTTNPVANEGWYYDAAGNQPLKLLLLASAIVRDKQIGGMRNADSHACPDSGVCHYSYSTK